MKRKSQAHIAEKLEKKREAWTERTARVFGVSPETARGLLAMPRRQSLRMNTLKSPVQTTVSKLRAIGWTGMQYSWMPEGYTIDSAFAGVRDSPPVLNGEAFIQNAASWLPVLALDLRPGDRVLDVCASPGGKTSHIAAITGNQARIWANDSSKDRLHKMQANLDRLGVAVERYTLFDAQYMARQLNGELFDKILVDAPCSGEGLRSIHNDKDVMGWSVAHIKRLQQEQKRIITQAWQLLTPGGVLVYSTCTIAPEENEAVIDYLLRSNEDATVMPLDIPLPNRVPALHEWNGRAFAPELQGCIRLQPSENIEAFFVCKLQKIGVSG